MSQIDQFHVGLGQLDSHMRALALLTDQPHPPADDVLAAARWAIVRSLAEIAAFQEKYLLAPIEAGGADAADIAQAREICSTTHARMQLLIEHAQRWPADAVRRDWSGFCRALPPVHSMIRDHFAWEARIVPPLLATLEGASAMPARNWTRPIWAVQESFQRG